MAGEDEGAELETCAQRHVDRFAILLDLWTCEEHYLQAKRKVRINEIDRTIFF